MTTSPSVPAGHAADAAPAPRSRHHGFSPRHFVRHYAEMVLAMVVGMVVLGIPADAALQAVGSSTSDLSSDAPALMLLAMAVAMTVPMVAWMRYRGHGWQPSAEMAGAMFVPTFAAIVVHASGLVNDFGAVMLGEHVVMLVAMLVAMVLRPSEYGHAATAA